jgi:phospholipase C
MRTALPLVLPLALAACAGNTAPMDAALDGAFDAGATDAPVDHMALRPPMITRTEPDSTLAARRQACAFHAGAWPAETLGTDVPIDTQIPIDHVLVLLQENRSFDHYFSRLPAAGQTDVDVAAADWTNPDASGTPVPRTHDTHYCYRDLNHSWTGSHAEYDNGANDGFVRANDPQGERALTYLDQTDLPFYYSLATTFAIGDRYHCSLLGPTMPNRIFAMAATSFGLTANTLVTQDTAASPVDHIFRRFDEAGMEWRDYAGGLRMIGVLSYYGLFRRETRAHLFTLDTLMTDLAAGNLPAFAFIEPSYSGNAGERFDEHPPSMPQTGEAFVERVVRAVMASPAWPRTALFITYDEHGGFADHVAPPAACPPDNYPPVDVQYQPVAGAFDRLGFRVPFFVVSPYARRHFVTHRVYDHTSILRFIEARFGLPAMTNRDANATPPTDMFDFTAPAFMTPPTLAPATVDPAAQMLCAQEFPSTGGL